MELREKIVDMVCESFGVTEFEIKSRTRIPRIVIARQVAMLLLIKHTKMKTVPTGSLFGLDHSSVTHAKKTILTQCEVDTKLKNKIDLIEFVIKEHKSEQSSGSLILDAISCIPQLNEAEYDLNKQLFELKEVASRLGLSKAVGFLNLQK